MGYSVRFQCGCADCGLLETYECERATSRDVKTLIEGAPLHFCWAPLCPGCRRALACRVCVYRWIGARERVRLIRMNCT